MLRLVLLCMRKRRGYTVEKEKAKFDKVAYNNAFNAKAYDRVNLTVEKGKKSMIKAHAESMGESVNGFINRAIDEAMKRDKKAVE